MDKENILVKPLNKKIYSDGRAVSFGFQYGTELIKFIKILKTEIKEFKCSYFYKIYNYTEYIFLKDIGNNMVKNRNNEIENFTIDLIIVALKENKVINLIKILDKIDNIKSVYNVKFEDYYSK